MQFDIKNLPTKSEQIDVICGARVRNGKFEFIAQLPANLFPLCKDISVIFWPEYKCAKPHYEGFTLTEHGAISSELHSRVISISNFLFYRVYKQTSGLFLKHHSVNDFDLQDDASLSSYYFNLSESWSPENYQPIDTQKFAYQGMLDSYFNFLNSKRGQ